MAAAHDKRQKEKSKGGAFTSGGGGCGSPNTPRLPQQPIRAVYPPNCFTLAECAGSQHRLKTHQRAPRMKLAFGFKKKAAKVCVQLDDDDDDEPPAQPAAKRARPDPPPPGARPQASPSVRPAAEPHVAGAGLSDSRCVLCADASPRGVRVCFHLELRPEVGARDVLAEVSRANASCTPDADAFAEANGITDDDRKVRVLAGPHCASQLGHTVRLPPHVKRTNARTTFVELTTLVAFTHASPAPDSATAPPHNRLSTS